MRRRCFGNAGLRSSRVTTPRSRSRIACRRGGGTWTMSPTRTGTRRRSSITLRPTITPPTRPPRRPRRYTQAGALAKIEYGLRAGSVYGVTPAGEVTFTTATDRTDVPTSTATGGDLACASGAACDVQSPTFWGRYRLTTIATLALKGSSLVPVDSWALAQCYPGTANCYPKLNDPTTAPSLWLESITRTGQDGGTDITLPPVTFAPLALANRVETAADLGDGYSIITRMRMYQVTSETGGSRRSLTTARRRRARRGISRRRMRTPRCVTPITGPRRGADRRSGLVQQVRGHRGDRAEHRRRRRSRCRRSYTYAGAAWHYDDDTLTRSADRTWDQWRGFRTVTTETGTAPDPVTKTTDTYFQGMDGDYQSGGGTSSVSLTSTYGTTRSPTPTSSPGWSSSTPSTTAPAAGWSPTPSRCRGHRRRPRPSPSPRRCRPCRRS